MKSAVGVAATLLLVALAVGTWVINPGASAEVGGWTQTVPSRVLDTRVGAFRQPGSITELGLAGHAGIPADAKTVILNLTVVDAQAPGYLTVYPCDTPRPTTSNVNFGRRATQANLVFATLDGSGKTCIYTLSRTHLLIDIQGYSTDAFGLGQPQRALDSRTQSVREAGSTTELRLSNQGVPAGARTAVLNLTVVDAEAPGYLTVFPCDQVRPTTSNVNYAKGTTQANLVVTAPSADGRVCIYTLSKTHIVVDVQGYTSDSFAPGAPQRVLDSRTEAAREPGSVTELALRGPGLVDDASNTALLNLTVVDAQALGFITIYPCDQPRPATSNINYAPGATQANLVVATLDPSGKVCIYSLARTHVVVDLLGHMTATIVTTPINANEIALTELYNGFVHPGVFLDNASLDEIRGHVAAGRRPWVDAYNKILNSGSSSSTSRRGSQRYSSLSFTPMPVPVLLDAASGNESYASANGLMEQGEVEHTDDARAAYTHALLWAVTGNQAYANKAIEIMNAWSSTLREIKFDSPVRSDNGQPVYNNGKLQAGWGASLFARAAEIVRYSNAGWADADVARFESMLHDIYLPLVISGWSNGANWMMTFAEATIAIGVFTDDRAAFDAGVTMWRQKMPTTIYMPSDGAYPIPPASNFNRADRMKALWYNPNQYIAGLQTETMRDLAHMTMGLGAMSNAAETAYIQGVDLYGEQADRIVTGFETNARFVNAYLDAGEPGGGWTPPGWPGGSGTLDPGSGMYKSGWLVGWHHFAVDLGYSMPETTRLVNRLGTGPTQAAIHNSWETLTHLGA